ncbi:hypothetical protein VOLCADRAFT_91596 [Volvox carteri f. nagariensis]|uniref:CBM20 domain-containing protein n=1 Tax=Volvox carteri f. nagariensis TaxID=3068 RepID=D8TXH7_VOLCA|nr:uncharacterized protein VOLCADRAFT_91596 [Volvox carteri f. nagariensis]EFJ47912.1 hypothetical protein VOLCADRAFT_91596 [Volvox carteri f. nagariensis]|eukprot:XP_002951018.1 hypothetical protein VOLCADRAFT_91596 [Volvox carteri f. nagariensis]
MAGVVRSSLGKDLQQPGTGHGRFDHGRVAAAARVDFVALPGSKWRFCRRRCAVDATLALGAAQLAGQTAACCLVVSTTHPSPSMLKHQQLQQQHYQQQRQHQRPMVWRSRDASKFKRGAHRSQVPVILKYGKHCNFGEAYAVVGSVSELGSWDPARAVKMRWTPGDVWVAHVQLPVDTEVQYKYVRINKDGALVAWEGADAGNGGCADAMGNLNLHVRPGHRVIWGHGVEVYDDLPPGGGGVSIGGGGASVADVSGTTTTAGGSSPASGTGSGPGFTNATGYGFETGAGGTSYPSFTPAPPGGGSTTIGGAANANANAPAASHDRHVAPAANDYNVVNPTASTPVTTGSSGFDFAAVPHITSTDLAATLIAAGPAAGAVSAAALGLPTDEGGSIPIVTPVAPPAAAHGGSGSGVDTMTTTAGAVPPPTVTTSGAPVEQQPDIGSFTSGPSATAVDTAASTAVPTENGPGNNGTGESNVGGTSFGGGGSGGGSRRRGPSFFRKRDLLLEISFLPPQVMFKNRQHTAHQEACPLSLKGLTKHVLLYYLCSQPKAVSQGPVPIP